MMLLRSSMYWAYDSSPSFGGFVIKDIATCRIAPVNAALLLQAVVCIMVSTLMYLAAYACRQAGGPVLDQCRHCLRHQSPQHPTLSKAVWHKAVRPTLVPVLSRAAASGHPTEAQGSKPRAVTGLRPYLSHDVG